jgi:DNA replication and repair protein RecF
VFTGANGTGKTNLLEAVSLLVPGRGLRAARFCDLARHGAAGPWGVAADFTGETPVSIGTGAAEPASERRAFLLDGAKPRTQADIAARLCAVWLTPQMDRLFTDSAGGRRRFLDRLVIALEPFHARALAAFEAAAAQRRRLLIEGADPDWLAALEDTAARHAVAATAARMALIAALNDTLAAGAAAPFPTVTLALDCPIAAALAVRPAVEVEDRLRGQLAAARALDALAPTSIGPQKSDLAISDSATGRPAALSSTGQQKAMLIGIVLGHAALIATRRGTPPLLLLDEPLVHLDQAHREALFAALARAGAGAWLTGTDAAPFAPLAAACYHVTPGAIEPA